MTKPLPTDCIKEHERVPTWRKFNLLLESVDFDDEIEQLFVVDIRFNKEEAASREYM